MQQFLGENLVRRQLGQTLAVGRFEVDRDPVGQAHRGQHLIPLRAGHDLEVNVTLKVVTVAQSFGRGDEAVLCMRAAAGDAGTEKDALGQALAVQLRDQAGQFVGRETDAAEVAPLPEGAIAAIPLAGRGEHRFEQRDALTVRQHGVVHAVGQLVAALGRRRAARSHHLLRRLIAGRGAKLFELLQCVH